MQPRAILLLGGALVMVVGAMVAYNGGDFYGPLPFLGLLLGAAFALTWSLPPTGLRPRLRAIAWTMGILGVGLLAAGLLSESTCTTSTTMAVGPGGQLVETPPVTECTHTGIPGASSEAVFVAGALALALLAAAVARARPFAVRREEAAEGGAQAQDEVGA